MNLLHYFFGAPEQPSVAELQRRRAIETERRLAQERALRAEVGVGERPSRWDGPRLRSQYHAAAEIGASHPLRPFERLDLIEGRIAQGQR